tara:strand:- start:1847 stop:2437 length:591 start_codon:yes stop_codon:yes gene_type:complete
MKRIAIIGDIGSGKSYVAKQFGYPVFNADLEVNKIYKNNKKCFKKLNKIFPEYIFSFPIDKREISIAILRNKKNIKKINKIVHAIVRLKMENFLKKNKKSSFVILDIPLLLENKINKKKDILVFVDADKKKIIQTLKKRLNFNKRIYNKLKKLQLPLEAKKKRSNFIIKNNFKHNYVKKNVNNILKKLNEKKNSYN